jgi:hypothetical protein
MLEALAQQFDARALSHIQEVDGIHVSTHSEGQGQMQANAHHINHMNEIMNGDLIGNGNGNDTGVNTLALTTTGAGTNAGTSAMQVFQNGLSELAKAVNANTHDGEGNGNVNVNGNGDGSEQNIMIDTANSISHHDSSSSIVSNSNSNSNNNSNNNQTKLNYNIGHLEKFSISITSLSVNPLSARDIIEKVQRRCHEVISMYLPCVEFLVLCQQELRNGLEMATRRSGRGRGYAMNVGQVRDHHHLYDCLVGRRIGSFEIRTNCVP